LPYRPFVRAGFVFHPGRDALRSERVCRGQPRSRITSQKEKQIQEQEVEETKSFEGPPPQTQFKTRVGRNFRDIRSCTRSQTPRPYPCEPIRSRAAKNQLEISSGNAILPAAAGVTPCANREIGVPGKKPKRGTWRLPVSALFFRRRGAFSASGGTHRVRGVMVAVCVLSPVESSSPPQLFEQQFPCTPMPHVWQARPCRFRKEEFRQGQSCISLLLTVRYGEHAMTGLLNEKALAKLIASNKHFGSAVAGKQV
jgi:hypothetical protein